MESRTSWIYVECGSVLVLNAVKGSRFLFGEARLAAV